MHPIEIAVVWECPTCGIQLAQLKGSPGYVLPCCWGTLEIEHELVEMEQRLPDRWGIPTDA